MSGPYSELIRFVQRVATSIPCQLTFQHGWAPGPHPSSSYLVPSPLNPLRVPSSAWQKFSVTNDGWLYPFCRAGAVWFPPTPSDCCKCRMRTCPLSNPLFSSTRCLIVKTTPASSPDGFVCEALRFSNHHPRVYGHHASLTHGISC